MTIATDLRLLANAADAQSDALDRLAFCVGAFLSAMDSQAPNFLLAKKIEQLREAQDAALTVLRS